MKKEITKILPVYLFVNTDAMVFLCDFHREQAWLRWLGNQQHGVHMHKEEILSQLRTIASSETEESLKEAIEGLKKGDV